MVGSITWWIGFRIWCEALLRKARARGGSGSVGGGVA
jgi:hypothetical protein